MEIQSKLVMSECGNLIDVSYDETCKSNPIHTPQSQTQVHHQDHKFKAWFNDNDVSSISYNKCSQYCNIYTYTSIIVKQEQAYITQTWDHNITYKLIFYVYNIGIIDHTPP